ncbi:MAG: triose-phosphate isomerase [Planctomycetaceae bacterium]|nr:triose-phosphate isomerase [Planctomycetaceae bacterium]
MEPNVRRPFVAGNWKMNMTRQSSIDLANALASGCSADIDVAVCPPSVYLDAVAQLINDSKIGLGAQDVYHEASGAYTGEISTEMLRDVGCKYVILGHSERRNILGESNAEVNKKLKAVLSADLIPIVCVGELLEQREAEQTLNVIKEQFDGSFADISSDQMKKCVIAYEPVWAIGTGKVATPEQAEEVHADIRRILTEQFDTAVADAVRIQYGGSVKPDNAGELMGQPNIDGALVGGASLKADSFLAIVAAAQQTQTA